MNKDIKALVESYNQGINHTERNTDSYAYAPKEYSTVRSEGEEDTTLKKRIALDLNNMTQRASRGLKDDYHFILTNLNKLKEDITKLITKV